MSGSGKAGRGVAATVLLIILIGGVALLYANRAAVFKGPQADPVEKSELARYATGSLARLETPATLVLAPDHPFNRRDGTVTGFGDFRGKVVVVNLWATWCAPCKIEMPTLARLAQAYSDPDFMVLPISVDTGAEPLAEATRFIDVHRPLPLFNDPSFQLPFLFSGKGGLPQTILLDRQGRVRATLTGEADWASPEARAVIDALLADGG